MVYTKSSSMCADIYTKVFTDPVKWNHACDLINVCHPDRIETLIRESHQRYMSDLLEVDQNPTGKKKNRGKTALDSINEQRQRQGLDSMEVDEVATAETIGATTQTKRKSDEVTTASTVDAKSMSKSKKSKQNKHH